MRIKAGDTVEIIRGEDVESRGTVRLVDPHKNRIVVESINIVTKHQRPIPAGRQQTQGGIIEIEAPIDASNAMLVCPSCQERTRVGYVVSEGGRKMRTCRKCKAQFD